MAKNNKKKGASISGVIAFLVLLCVINEYLTVILTIIVALLVLSVLYIFYKKHKETHINNTAQNARVQTQKASIDKSQVQRMVEPSYEKSSLN